MAGFDLVAFQEAAPGTGTVGITRAALDTRYAETDGDNARVKKEAAYLLGLWYAAETTPNHALLAQDSRLQDLQFVKSADLNDADIAAGFSDYLKCPIHIRGGDMVNVYSENATDEDTIIGLLLGSGAIPSPVAPTHLLRGVADKTLTALNWGTLTMVWDDSIPDGLYTIIGMTVGAYVASGYMSGFARIISDKFLWRPGVALIQAEADKTSVMSSLGVEPNWNWGYMEALTFHSKSMPQIEVVSPAALTDFAIELRLVAHDEKNVGNLAAE